MYWLLITWQFLNMPYLPLGILRLQCVKCIILLYTGMFKELNLVCLGTASVSLNGSYQLCPLELTETM